MAAKHKRDHAVWVKLAIVPAVIAALAAEAQAA
jgi:hypothetical protein